ncbi:hypothetical protein [Streptomyces sp. NBC_01571]|uniref:hypothetical protein n=1 Tax=unclassified Streptomyces TaxID=2593676 RepID=UPI002259D37C|nr:hypothetical protein [Streptomyces sp. NBC_01571]MCX4576358.1 hypothetical protein [Streptomyces sp. NBC_01571]
MLRRISARYFRVLGAAVIAVAALVLAANAGPARAADPAPALHQQGSGHPETAYGGISTRP